ncbi:MAG: hypothetical protein QOD75_50 [Blastocatellia bacterium]|jgi:hypothetical protein|nr:hypothetical protein [Blastocatellia bacterium]
MNLAQTQTRISDSRSSERGAALIMTLLIASLVLAAGGALILTTGMSATTAVDATAEMQAYYGAEAGLQATLNILRGNVAPHDVANGTKITFRNAVTNSTCNASTDPAGAPPLRLSGWLQYNYSTGTYPDRVKVNPTDGTYTPLTGIAFSVQISDPDNTPVADGDPTRLLIRSTGYGPKGATKNLEMVVHRNFVSFGLPAAITLVGGASMTFAMGNSNASGYSGDDHHSPPLAGVAAVAVSAANLNGAQTIINNLNAQGGGGNQVTPSAALQLSDTNTPSFLTTAEKARSFLALERDIAQGDGRYFLSQADVTGGMGTDITPLTTFIDNYGGAAVDLGSGLQGVGLLIVTGNLITHGNTDFKGLILVLGAGRLDRDGNGNGHVDGGIIVANFDPSPTGTGGFNNPYFSVNGAGNSDVRYDSEAIRKAFDSAGVSVAGLHEY